MLPDTPGLPPRVRAYSTSAQRIVPIGPTAGTAGLYVCGITPYDATHLGHAFTYLTFDLLNRAWRDAGLDVRYVQNVTDVDDPLLERAAQTGRDWRDLAAGQIERYRSDMTALRVLAPDHYVAATEALDDVIDLIGRLRSAGQVYRIADIDYPDWYVRIAQAPHFGEESHLGHVDMLTEFAEHGGDPQRPGKQDPLDALVWRMARPDEPSWPSELGQGRPGWHVECTAIALRYLGSNFAVQGGGSDLAFPHHEMCAAQAWLATGQPFANAYLHAGMVGLDGEKMSKSKGNLELVSNLMFHHADPMAIRLALLAHHYRVDWEWTPDQLDQAQRRLDAWRAASRLPAGPEPTELLARVRIALREDLNAPAALAAIDEWTAAALSGDGANPQAPALVAALTDALLGVRL